MKKAYLVLENGEVFEGLAIGAEREQIGELVFTTGMTGYLETLTDPSYAGQIILQTFPLIGNYGLIPEDFEGECLARGYVVRELCDEPSNFRSRGSLENFLKERNIPGICGVDTRAIAKRLREQGTMNAAICTVPPENLEALQEAAGQGVVCVPATGRIVSAIPPVVRQLPFVRYFIVTNGAAIYDAREDRLLLRADIPLELALDCCRYMAGLPFVYDCYQNERGWMNRAFYENLEPFFVTEPRMLELIRQTRTPVEDLYETLKARGEPVQKLQMFFRPEDLPLRAEILERIPVLFPELVATTSVSNNIEINSVSAGKGKALRALAVHLGIGIGETVAFGDGTNDCELLQAAGLGVAMANADPKVKAVADAICESNNEAGVGKTILRLLGERA